MQFDQLVIAVSRDLRDPGNVTFGTDAVADLINAGLSEVGRIAPARFRTDIVPVADQLDYVIQGGEPEIEVRRVELWDVSQTPERCLMRLRSKNGEYMGISAAGWEFWDGTLTLTNAQEDFIDPVVHRIRVWGYGPYTAVAGSTAMPVSTEIEWAIRAYCQVEALRRLQFDRDLFTQWQGKAGNTDVTPAGLMNALSLAQEDWRRRSRALLVLRESA